MSDERKSIGSLLVNAAFLSHARHELLNPLNAIIGFSELLLEDAEPEIKGDLAKINSAGKTLLVRVNEVFDPSIIDRHESSADLIAVIGEACHELRTPLNAVIGYSEMLLEEAEDGPTASIKRDLERIHGAGKKFLKLVDDLVGITDLGGHAVLHDGSAKKNLSTGQTGDRPARATADPSSGFVLIVDDSETNRDLLSRRLTRQGYRVANADGGRAALEMMRTVSFDVLLLDVLMPDMDGYRVLEEMKADPALRDTPVVMISALDEIDSVVRCIEAGAEDYLAKPFNPVLLNARVGACLDKKRMRDRELLYLRQIEDEKNRSNELLHVILPDEIVQELAATNRVEPRRCDDVAVLFCDIVEFTAYCASHTAEDVITHLQELIESYEEIIARNGMEKIKTVGDSTMATAGLLKPASNPVLSCVQCGLEMIETASSLSAGWTVRVGIHVGPVVAGVVGRKSYLFDLWGDTVNTASRVESHGIDGAVNLSLTAWSRVASLCRGESIGPIKVKGKGTIEVFRVDGLVEVAE